MIISRIRVWHGNRGRYFFHRLNINIALPFQCQNVVVRKGSSHKISIREDTVSDWGLKCDFWSKKSVAHYRAKTPAAIFMVLRPNAANMRQQILHCTKIIQKINHLTSRHDRNKSNISSILTSRDGFFSNLAHSMYSLGIRTFCFGVILKRTRLITNNYAILEVWVFFDPLIKSLQGWIRSNF